MKRSNLFKRSAAMLLAGLMAVSMSACGGSSASGNDSGDSQASSSGDTHKLSVVLKTTSSEYWSYVIAGIEQAEKDLGNVEVDVRGANSDTDFDGQLNMVETIVKRRYVRSDCNRTAAGRPDRKCTDWCKDSGSGDRHQF